MVVDNLGSGSGGVKINFYRTCDTKGQWCETCFFWEWWWLDADGIYSFWWWSGRRSRYVVWNIF
jgi:hypothetical protein